MGAAAVDKSKSSPVSPMAFLISSDAPTKVSIVSANMPPTTGTK